MNAVTSHHKTVSLDDLVIDDRVQRTEGIDQRRVDRPLKKRVISLGRTHLVSVSRMPRALVVYSQ